MYLGIEFEFTWGGFLSGVVRTKSQRRWRCHRWENFEGRWIFKSSNWCKVDESFKDAGITKILTIEASGIAPAIMASFHFDVPCLFAKKAKPSTLKDGFYSTDIHSFTKNKTSTVIVSEEFLGADDKVLIIDDFLANGDASLGLNDIVKQANATTVGVGIVVEKSFQNGRQRLEDAGLYVSSLCKVASLKGNKVTLLGEA